jgi:hypothetical protein
VKLGPLCHVQNLLELKNFEYYGKPPGIFRRGAEMQRVSTATGRQKLEGLDFPFGSLLIYTNLEC